MKLGMTLGNYLNDQENVNKLKGKSMKEIMQIWSEDSGSNKSYEEKTNKELLITHLGIMSHEGELSPRVLKSLSERKGYGGCQITTCQLAWEMDEYDEDYYGETGVQVNIFYDNTNSNPELDYTRIIPEQEFIDLIAEILQECELMTEQNKLLLDVIRKNWGLN